MKKIKLGIVGLGVFFQKTHLNVLQGIPEKFEVRGIYTSDAEKFRRMKEIFPEAKHFRSVNAIFKDPDIDAVAACVPIPQHLAVAQKAIQSRKALLLEKPLAATISQGRQIVRLAQKSRVPVMVAESFRYFEIFRKLKKMLDEKILGKIEFIQIQAVKKFDEKNPYYKTKWRINPRQYPGILWDAGIHAISLLRFLFGSFTVQYKTSKSFNPVVGKKDTLLAHLKFANKTDSLLLMSYGLFGQEEHFLTIYCSRGRIKCGINSFSVESDRGVHKYEFKENVYTKIYEDFYRLAAQKQKPAYTLEAAYQDLAAVHALVNK